MNEFNLNEIDKTFVNYKDKKLHEGIVFAIQPEGIVFNLGGKVDAFISKDEIENFGERKIGERFSVVLLGGKNEDGLFLASQKKTEKIEVENQNAKSIKLGCSFTCVIDSIKNNCLVSHLGDYTIEIPEAEISIRKINPKFLLHKKVDAIAIEINSETKNIKGSIRILEEKEKQANEDIFWRTNFVNKVVDGKVKNFTTYGAFVDVGGVNCLAHISNLSNKKLQSPSEVLEIGKTYKFRILEMNKNTKRVSLGIKQL